MGDIHTNPSLSIKRTYEIELLKSLIFYQENICVLRQKKPNFSIDEELIDPNKQHYVFYCNEIPVGVASFLKFTYLENSPNIYFVDIGIIKEYRGKLALEFSKKMLDIFYLQNDVSQLLCVVEINHAGCVCFFKKLGFGIIEKHSKYFLLEAKYEWDRRYTN